MQKRKSYIVAGIIVAVVLAIFFSGDLILDNYIEKELHNRQFGNYKLQIRKTDVSVVLRKITFSDVSVEDSSSNQRIISPQIKATGIRLFPLIFNDKVIVNKVLAERPEITILQNEPDEKDRQENVNTSEQKREINSIRIGQLLIEDSSVLLQQQASDEKDTLLSFHAGVEIKNLNIFDNNEHLKLHNHSAERLEIRFTNGTYYLPEDLYKLQFGSLSFNSEQEILNMQDVSLTSIHSKYGIGKNTGVETDWYNIALEQLALEGININALLSDTAVVFRSAILDGLNATIFRDKRPPFPEKPDSKLPMEMLESLSLPLHSDSILIKNGHIVYEEHGEESSTPGRITFSRVYASIYNLSTVQDSIEGPTAMDARALVMDEALLKATFTFPNSIYPRQYQVSGNMESISAAAFNPMLVPSAFVEVEDGIIKALDFSFSYDNQKADGNLSLQYENLNISLLDKEDGSKKTLKTFLTETFILQEDNLKADNSYQKGTISFERDKKKSVFNYWWKSLFSGIKDILAF